MKPFEHILVATDFTALACNAEDRAVRLAQALGAKLTLLHVHHVPPVLPTEGLLMPYDELESAARQALDQKAQSLRARFPDLRVALRTGYPDVEIVAAAKDLGADLIVMGTHGRRGLRRALLGSVAARVVRTSPIPVLTVAPTPREESAASARP